MVANILQENLLGEFSWMVLGVNNLTPKENISVDISGDSISMETTSKEHYDEVVNLINPFIRDLKRLNKIYGYSYVVNSDTEKQINIFSNPNQVIISLRLALTGGQQCVISNDKSI